MVFTNIDNQYSRGDKLIIIITIRQMGQQQSQSQPHSARTFHYHSTQSQAKQIQNRRSIQHIEHEGILKLRSTPFPNCAEISNDGVLMFLENAQTTLDELLQNRYYTNRLFPVDDIYRLIENVIYTLAYLAENNCVYRDLCPENIYYSHGMFKLLPNQLIQERFYERAWDNYYGLHNQNRQQQNIFPYLSPELVIALRMKEKNIQDTEILNKSNVFILGLILLESTTLMPSSQCFDSKNYDIFNNIISQRLDLVEEHYNECIARIIANMLDYDFNQRMDLKELSIWINRQLTLFRKQKESSKYETYEDKKQLVPNKSSMSIHKSRLVTQQPDKQPQNPPTLNINTNIQYNQPAQIQNRPVNRTKTNMIYINGYDDGTAKQDSRYNQSSFRGAKNNVYLQNFPQYEVDYQIDKKIQQKHDMVTLANISGYRDRERERDPYVPNAHRNQPRFKYQYERDDYSRPQQQSFQQPRLSRNYQKSNNQRVPEYAAYTPPPPAKSSYLRQVQNIKSKNLVEDQPDLKRIYEKTANIPETGSTPKVQKPNGGKKFYPSISEMQNIQKQHEITKRVPKNSQYTKNMGPSSNGDNSRAKQSFQSKQSKQSDSKCSINDGSINRIKMQIEKSRKLIEEFRKCEGVSNQ